MADLSHTWDLAGGGDLSVMHMVPSAEIERPRLMSIAMTAEAADPDKVGGTCAYILGRMSRMKIFLGPMVYTGKFESALALQREAVE